jgi:hypothetical protein
MGTTGRSDYDPNDPLAQQRAMMEAAQSQAMSQVTPDEGDGGNNYDIMAFADALSPRGFGAGILGPQPSLSPLDVPNAFFPEGCEDPFAARSAAVGAAGSSGVEGPDPLGMSLNSLDSLFSGRNRSLSNSREGPLLFGSRPNSNKAADATGTGGNFPFEPRSSFEQLQDDDPNFAGLQRSAYQHGRMPLTSPGAQYPEGADSMLNSLKSNISDSYYMSEYDDGRASLDTENLQLNRLNSGGSATARSQAQPPQPPVVAGGSKAFNKPAFIKPTLSLEVPDNTLAPRRARGIAPAISFNDVSPRSAGQSLPAPPPGHGLPASKALRGVQQMREPDQSLLQGGEGEDSDMSDLFLSKVVLETLQHNTPRSPGSQQTKRPRRGSPRPYPGEY